ncbi:MAG: Re/Si-specific NAD(P)(+) transhydrogenase subunit alpha [Sediminibacterium sp.]|jgi:NAD(P) transhydrogenase subunit alpha|nr:Re/Si-specific NAD(P)(+) transhydrogenase subunit alpha [Sediminibacterium sp.]MBP7990318.1 Re/Si-specific NAD(P)(+) transhydrogenase subunit alpha [Sediminibacterium sp.]
MILGILKETNNDKRVSLLPEQAAVLVAKQVSVIVETGAGSAAYAADATYTDKNVSVKDRATVLSTADLVLSINPLSSAEMAQLKPGAVVLGTFQPLFNIDLVKQAIDKKASLFSMDMIPRTTRAQSMDVLSSQANIAGYRAVLLAATMFPKYFPMFMTAAGSIPPAKMVIIGAGVAGLQAIATAKRLGAVVEVSDTRPQVKEEVMSLGAKFIEVEGAADASKAGGYAVEQSEDFKQRQQQRLAESIAKADIIITTAQIPGKKAPVLITDAMLKSMKPGSVVIDLAAATGGNTAVTKNNETIVYEGVTILGNSNLASDMPSDASKLYGKNILNFLQLIITKEGALELNFEDDLVKGCCMAHEGAVANERVAALIN